VIIKNFEWENPADFTHVIGRYSRFKFRSSVFSQFSDYLNVTIFCLWLSSIY